MKTLKKALCLVLALVMVVGTVALSASAAEKIDNFAAFTEDGEDAKTSPYAPAVDTLIGSGLINGVSATKSGLGDGEVLTREQAAKIVAYLKLGQAAADGLDKTGVVFTDVESGRWSNGFISYAAYIGILAGDGNGTFRPTGTVKGTEMAKMLLNALGYGIKKSTVSVVENGMIVSKEVVTNEYEGTYWSVLVSEQANALGLYAGLDGVDLGAAITRAQALQMVFNAVQKLDVNGAPLKYYVTADNSGSDTYGRPLTSYKCNGKTVSAEYPSSEIVAVYTYTAKDGSCATYADVLKKMNKGIDDAAKKYKFDTTVDPTETIDIGDRVEFFADKDDKLLLTDAIVSWFDVYEVESVGTKKDDDGNYKVTFTNAASTTTGKLAGAEKGKIFYVPTAADGTADFENAVEAEPITGTVGAYGAGNAFVTVAGTNYYDAIDYTNFDITDGLKIDEMKDADNKPDFKGEYNFFVTPYGDLVGVTLAKADETSATKNYGFVVAYEAIEAKDGTGSTQLTTGESKDASVKVEILNLEGKDVIINLAMKDKKVTGKQLTVSAKKATEGAENAAVVAVAATVVEDYPVVEYTLNDDGKAVITALYTTSELATGTTKGAVDSFGATLTSSTELKGLFFKHKDDDKTKDVTGYEVAAVKGYKNFPAFDKGAKYYVVNNDAGKAATVYVIGDKVPEAAAVVKDHDVYIVTKVDTSLTAKGYKYTFSHNGKSESYYNASATAAAKGDVLFDITVKDGKWSDGTKATAVVASKKVVSVDAGYIETESGIYETPATVTIYDATDKDLDSVKKDQTISIYETATDDKGTTKILVIIEKIEK